MNAPTPMSKADWGRFQRGASAKRCITCGHAADVTIKLTATELDDGKSGTMLTTETLSYCHTHGVLRYGDALRKLQGS